MSKKSAKAISFSGTIVLITGASRGIGKGLLELYLAKPNHTVVAANRDPNRIISKALADLPKADGTSLLLVKIDSTVPTDPAEAVKQLASYGIDHLDIIIANAGYPISGPRSLKSRSRICKSIPFNNTYSVIWLYQAALPLLKQSKNPIWVSMGSSSAYLTVNVLQHTRNT